MDIVRSLLGICRIFPVNCELLVISILGRETQSFSSTVYAIEVICVHQL